MPFSTEAVDSLKASVGRIKKFCGRYQKEQI